MPTSVRESLEYEVEKLTGESHVTTLSDESDLDLTRVGSSNDSGLHSVDSDDDQVDDVVGSSLSKSAKRRLRRKRQITYMRAALHCQGATPPQLPTVVQIGDIWCGSGKQKHAVAADHRTKFSHLIGVVSPSEAAGREGLGHRFSVESQAVTGRAPMPLTFVPSSPTCRHSNGGTAFDGGASSSPTAASCRGDASSRSPQMRAPQSYDASARVPSSMWCPPRGLFVSPLSPACHRHTLTTPLVMTPTTCASTPVGVTDLVAMLRAAAPEIYED